MGCFVCVKDKTDSTAGIEDPVYSYVGSCNYESQKNTWHQEMELEKWSVMRYNSSQLKGMWFLGCSTLLSILNLHFDIRDSYILERMSGLQRVEGRCLSADAHLALLGVNYSGNGILGLRKIKSPKPKCSAKIVRKSIFIFFEFLCHLLIFTAIAVVNRANRWRKKRCSD